MCITQTTQNWGSVTSCETAYTEIPLGGCGSRGWGIQCALWFRPFRCQYHHGMNTLTAPIPIRPKYPMDAPLRSRVGKATTENNARRRKPPIATLVVDRFDSGRQMRHRR
jgi:hypothetical protein